jgi:hypothetical protein
MTEKNDKITDDVLLGDALVRLKTLEEILIAKGIFTKEEYADQMQIITAKISKYILQQAKVEGNLDDIVKSIQNPSKTQN